MSKTKIEPCPWCGSLPDLETLNHKYYYVCNNLECVVNPITPAYKTKGSATRTWNMCKNSHKAIAKKIFADIEGNVVTKVRKDGNIIWQSPISIDQLKKKYGVN